MSTDIQLYTDYMAEVRVRTSVVQALLEGRMTTGIEGCNTELIFLQLRKTLEVIAFASLSANKDAYSVVHENFAKHWNAKRMQADLEKVNPDYYPQPIEVEGPDANGVKHATPLTAGFLTKDDFVLLYNICSQVLHKPNPYKSGDPTIDTPYSLAKWVELIQTLLGCHVAILTSGDKWIVQIPNEGPIQTVLARPQ